MNDNTAGRGTNPVAVLAAMLQAVAESADGSQGRQLWASLARLLNIRSSAGTSGEVAGAAELAALRQEPGDTDRAQALARVLLARAAYDGRFRNALNDWRGQRPIQALERSVSGHWQAGAVGSLSASREHESRDENATSSQVIMKRISDLMVRLGGSDKFILAQVPQERTRFTQMANILLTTAGTASLSMIFALHDGVKTPLAVAILIGLI